MTDMRTYTVLMNHEEQYGILPHVLPRPEGWREGGFVGKHQECVDWVDAHWIDMRPLSARTEITGTGVDPV